MRFLIACLMLALATPVLAAEPTPLSKAMAQVRADRWSRAEELASEAGPVALDIVEWRRLRAGQGTFPEYLDFLTRNADWPGLDLLRAQGEGTIPGDADPDDVVAFFGGERPFTGAGALRLVQAHAARGEVGDAHATAVLAWRSLALSGSAQTALWARFKTQLAPHHEARIDEMLWQGQFVSARRMLPFVPEHWDQLLEARIALREQAPGVDALIEEVPDAYRDDAGLAYERFLWRTRKGRHEDAIALMEERSG